ncbi:MAG: hypothetical protein JNL39_02815 [Opitutaceae bacterium]|nr:hypothetical protein [Opitutaceae bacterium]
MSAKHPKRKTPAPTPAPATPAPVSAPAAAAEPSWLDSADPKKRMWGKIVLVALWIYVAALCLLALDQWFRWGIFGPKIPPVP